MTQTAIKVEGLSKLYRLGTRAPYHRLTDTLQSLAALPLKLLTRRSGSSAPQAAPAVGDRFSDAPPGYFWSLKDIDFHVPEGQVVGIIGRNGAGKSTLLKILSRITAPTRGNITIRGRVGSLLEVGTGFHPELSGRENIFLNGAILGMKRAEILKKFDEIVAFSEVEKFLDSPVKHYSSGMYMRLAFAVAAHLEPEVLIVDEVLAVGDAGFQRKCLGKMGEVAKTGRTVLFVSHNIQAIQAMCQQCIWLDAGQVKMAGPASDVISRYVAGLSEGHSSLSIQNMIDAVRKDRVFKLNALEVRQDDAAIGQFISGKSISVVVDFELAESTEGFHLYIQTLTTDGTVVFESIHNGHIPSPPPTPQGRYVAQVTIPADFFNQGDYVLVVRAGIHNVRSCIEPPIQIPLHIDMLGRVNQAYSGYKAPGFIAPLLSWEITPATGI